MSIISKITGLFKKNPHNLEKDRQSKIHLYLGKFVRQNNTDIGETIAVEGNRVIIKNTESIMSIPLEAVIKASEDVVVGDFDMGESLRLGKEWADRKDLLEFDDKGMMIR